MTTARTILLPKTDIFVLFIYSSLIFYLSSQSDPAPTVVSFLDFPQADKVFHAMEYAVLGVLWFRVLLRVDFHNPSVLVPVVSVLICLGYAVLDEFLQQYVPNRMSSMGDLVADGIGACLAVGIRQAVWRRRFHFAKQKSFKAGGTVTY